MWTIRTRDQEQRCFKARNRVIDAVSREAIPIENWIKPNSNKSYIEWKLKIIRKVDLAIQGIRNVER